MILLPLHGIPSRKARFHLRQEETEEQIDCDLSNITEAHEMKGLCCPEYQSQDPNLGPVFLILGQRKETAHTRSKPTLTKSGIAGSCQVLLSVGVSAARTGLGDISSVLLEQAGSSEVTLKEGSNIQEVRK